MKNQQKDDDIQSDQPTDEQIKNEQPENCGGCESEEYKNKYLRALADYQNILKRVERERKEYIAFANENVLQKLLPVVDDLKKAAHHIKDEGIQLIYKKLVSLLESEGVKRIEFKETDPFDPAIMECIETEKGGTLLVELRAGYIKEGKVLRPVQVKVAKKSEI